MRIRTDGKYSNRKTVLEDNAELWGCNKTDAILQSCKFAMAMLGQPDLPSDNGALGAALSHPDMTESLAKALSTKYAELEYKEEIKREIQLPEQ